MIFIFAILRNKLNKSLQGCFTHSILVLALFNPDAYFKHNIDVKERGHKIVTVYVLIQVKLKGN